MDFLISSSFHLLKKNGNENRVNTMRHAAGRYFSQNGKIRFSKDSPGKMARGRGGPRSSVVVAFLCHLLELLEA